MNIQQFIFSEKRSHKIARHFTFWVVISILFFIQSIIPVLQIYETAFISLCCFIPVCLLVSYVSIYFLLPYTIQRKQYIRFTVFFLLAVLIGFWINVAAAELFFRLADGYVAIHSDAKSGGLAAVNTSHAVVIAGLALGIKFTKNWYQQYKENGTEQRKKIKTELQLEKARLYPQFLFQSLEKLQNGIKSGSPRASELLLMISDLLSYIVYQSDEKWIALEDELEMVQNRIQVEEVNGEKKIDVEIIGETTNKQVSPMAIFSFVEDCLKANENLPGNDSLLRMKISVHPEFVVLQIQKTHMTKEDEDIFRNILEGSLCRIDVLHQGRASIELKKGEAYFTARIQVAITKIIPNLNEMEMTTTNFGV